MIAPTSAAVVLKAVEYFGKKGLHELLDVARILLIISDKFENNIKINIYHNLYIYYVFKESGSPHVLVV